MHLLTSRDFALLDAIEIEKIEDSEVFASYARYYIVELSTNKDILKYWQEGLPIAVFRGND